MTSDEASLQRVAAMLEDLAAGLEQVMPAVRRHHQSFANLTERIATVGGCQAWVDQLVADMADDYGFGRIEAARQRPVEWWESVL